MQPYMMVSICASVWSIEFTLNFQIIIHRSRLCCVHTCVHPCYPIVVLKVVSCCIVFSYRSSSTGCSCKIDCLVKSRKIVLKGEIWYGVPRVITVFQVNWMKIGDWCHLAYFLYFFAYPHLCVFSVFLCHIVLLFAKKKKRRRRFACNYANHSTKNLLLIYVENILKKYFW
jgi:hypothetical protein